jgi:hypothetical protein
MRMPPLSALMLLLAPVAARADGPTYHQDVAPLLRRHCSACHHPAGSAPFSLLSYEQAARWAASIKERVRDRRMPPWLPAGGLPLRDERRLSAAEIATLSAWVDARAPAGAAVEQRLVAATESWPLGTPDLVLAPAQPFHLAADGPDIFRCFALPTGLQEERWVVGYDIQPANPRIVHHVVNFFDTTGAARSLEQRQPAPGADRGAGYTVDMGTGFAAEDPARFGQLGTWAPGQRPQLLPAGAGYRLPGRADLVMQVHYHRDGRAADDRTRIGLYFAKGPVAQPWQTLYVSGLRRHQFLPAGAPRIVTRGSTLIQTDCILHSLMPHMHLLGSSLRVTLTPPAGAPQLLLDVPRWDYRWQETYWFRDPIRVAAGSVIEIEGVFDNSALNPSNPNRPPRLVLYGTQATDEMLYVYFGATSTREPWQPIRFEPRLPAVVSGE